jgi:proteasome accessory factor B
MTSKLERLLNLTAALLATARPLTAEQLRARVEGYADNDASFRRAFERDKDDLRSMGIPVKVVEITNTDPPASGYVIDRREYSGKDPQLAPDELAALHVAANLVRLGADTTGALWKLGGVVDAPEGSTLPGGGAGDEPLVALPGDPNLAPLFQAATELRAARFRYNDVDRTVEPLRLSFVRGHWYLAAFDRTRADERLYRIDRIDGEVTIGPPGAFARRSATSADPHVQSWELGDGDGVRAEVLVDADQAPFAIQQLGEDAVVERRGSGDLVVALDVRNPAAFRSFVLSFLEHAEVLSPPGLRADVTDWLTVIAASAPNGGHT